MAIIVGNHQSKSNILDSLSNYHTSWGSKPLWFWRCCRLQHEQQSFLTTFNSIPRFQLFELNLTTNIQRDSQQFSKTTSSSWCILIGPTHSSIPARATTRDIEDLAKPFRKPWQPKYTRQPHPIVAITVTDTSNENIRFTTSGLISSTMQAIN